jgi:TatD DNase family protein
MLQDTHIHIQEIRSSEAMARFSADVMAAGLGRFFNCATQPLDWPVLRLWADTYQGVIPFFGIHPWFVRQADETAFLQMEGYLALPDALVGEIGLDKARKDIDLEHQKDIFIRQLMLAKKYNKPFAVHCVRAWEDTLRLIRAHAAGLRFLIHSFNGSVEIAREVAGMGGFFSIGVKEFSNSNAPLRAVFEGLPADRIFLETDFPYQIKAVDPVAYMEALRNGYQTAAAWRKVPLETFIRMVYDNGTIFAHTTADR